MKQKITLLAILFLITILTFGQKPETKNNEKFWKSKAERQIKRLIQNDIGLTQNHLIKNARNISQYPALKSSRDIKQRLDSFALQGGIDEFTDQWVNVEKEEFIYDANMNLIQELEYYWDETTGQWIAYSKYEYTFTTTGNLTQELEYDWDKTTGQWIADWKTDYTYNINGNLTQELIYRWDETTGQWDAYYKYEYTFATNGNLTQMLRYRSYGTTSSWDVTWKTDYTYDTNGNLTQEIYYVWDKSTSQWNATAKTDYTYDTNGNMTQELDFDWDENTIQWVTNYKYQYTYDTNGNLKQELDYDWDQTTGQWIPNWKTNYTYDNSYSFSDLILPYFYTIDEMSMLFNHMLISGLSFVWDEDSSDWVFNFKIPFYYSEQNIDAVYENKGAELKVYPNPSIDYLNIEFPSNMNVSYIEIINMQGMVVKQKEVGTNQNTIDIQDLSYGVYFIRVHTDKGIVMKKLIKQ